MAWQRHCHPANPCWVLAVCLPCAWFSVVPRGVLALWRRSPTKEPGDWQKRKCLASRLLQISSPIRGKARCPGRWRAMRRGWATCAQSNKGEVREGQSPHQVLTWSHQVCLVYQRPTARMDGVIPKNPRSVASSSAKKPVLGRAWKLAGACLAGVRKGGALFHQPSRNSPMRWGPPGGGLPRDHSTHAPPSRSDLAAVYEPTRGPWFFSLSLCPPHCPLCCWPAAAASSSMVVPQGRLIEGPTVPRNESWMWTLSMMGDAGETFSSEMRALSTLVLAQAVAE